MGLAQRYFGKEKKPVQKEQWATLEIFAGGNYEKSNLNTTAGKCKE